jgi:hypothetical protein
VADRGAVRSPARRCERLVRGVCKDAEAWDSSMVATWGGTLKRLMCEPFPREAKPEPGTPREVPLLKLLL